MGSGWGDAITGGFAQSVANQREILDRRGIAAMLDHLGENVTSEEQAAAAADGFGRLAVGQGADELFGGYSKVADPVGDDRVAAETVRGARTETVRSLPDQLERDVLALRAAGVEPVAPLLDDRIVAAALALPGELLASDGDRKIALRRAAAGRVPESVRTADKKAVQYGTYVSRELDRLARRAGFKRRMDDHVGQYLDALLTE
jgi:asparagine synthase (glutamine-hydrolysing)